MMKITRPDAPDWLAKNWENWGQQWANKLADPTKSRKFEWAIFEKTPVNQRVLPHLRSMTGGHCAFCDGYPISATGETVEHFRPKSAFPLLAYQWENLFYACHYCQQKFNEFHELLLKPDELDYEFDPFFIVNFIDGSLEPNPTASPENQFRAAKTIQLYRLNEFDRPATRLWVFDNFKPFQPDERPYRFLFF